MKVFACKHGFSLKISQELEISIGSFVLERMSLLAGMTTTLKSQKKKKNGNGEAGFGKVR